MPVIPRPQLSLARLVEDPLAELRRLGAQEPAAAAFLGRQRIVYLSDPALVDEVFVANDRNVGRVGPVSRWWVRSPAPYLVGPELSTHDRSVYMPVRRRLMAHYGHAAATALAPALVELASGLFARAQGRELRLFDFLEEVLVAAAATFVIGSPVAGARLAPVLDLYAKTADLGAQTFTSPARSRAVARSYSAARDAAEGVRAELARLLVALANEPNGGSASIAELHARGDLSADLVSGLVETAFDPSAPPLAFLLSTLADDDVAASLARAGEELLAAPEGAVPAPLGAAVDEALRLAPPWSLNRVVLVPFAYSGGPARVGDVFVASPYLLGRDPRWWRRPDEFWFGHWDPDAVATRPPRAFAPFGFASRICVARRMASTFMAVVAALLATRWRPVCPDVAAVSWEALPSGVMRPREPVPLRIVPR